MDLGVTPIDPVYKRRGSLDRQEVSGVDIDGDTMYWRGSESLKICKQEQQDQTENANSTFSLFASLLDSAFQGELPHFQAGVTMEISVLDAWYSSADGSLEGQATFVVHGLCRKCCIPEIILRSMQISVSLIKSGYPPERHHELIELVTSP